MKTDIQHFHDRIFMPIIPVVNRPLTNKHMSMLSLNSRRILVKKTNGKYIKQILSESKVCWGVRHSRLLEERLCVIDNQACVFKPSLNNSSLPWCAPLHNNICSPHTSQTMIPQQKHCCLCVLAALCSSTLPKYFFKPKFSNLFSVHLNLF